MLRCGMYFTDVICDDLSAFRAFRDREAVGAGSIGEASQLPLGELVAEKASEKRRRAREGSGAWGRIRTTDTRIFNPLLYQLSYPGEGRRRGEPRL
jgi:hypothetical protein